MKRTNNIFISFAVVSISTLIMLGLADITLKILELPVMYRAVMLLSGSKLYTDSYGVRRYEPHKEVEQAAYIINGDLAYRYKYHTNNLGLVSKFDYDSERPLDLMIAGDSVTEGQEVGPWVDVMQERLLIDHGKTSQNFAIAGNGFIEFAQAATFAKTELKAKKAMLIFIGGDLTRPGDLMQANDECSTYRTLINCDQVNCRSGNTTWFHYEAKLSDQELISFAKRWQRFGLIRTARQPVVSSALFVATQACRTGIELNWSGWMAKRYAYHCAVTKAEDDLRSVAATAKTIAPQLVESSEKPSTANLIPAYTINALEKILQLYGPENVLLVAIPGGANLIRDMQPEVIFNRALGNKFKSPIQFVDMSETCDMTGLWAPRAGTGPGRGWGHPTVEGYLTLQKCFLTNDRVIEFSKS